jgi:hypothetical protein
MTPHLRPARTSWPARRAVLAATLARRMRGDRGAVAVEIAVGVPMMVVVVLLAAGSYLMARANLDVNAAASAAARAASLARSAAAANTAATEAASANLAGHCARLRIDVNTGAFHRGGQVSVVVSCTVTTHGLTGVGLPGSTTFTATATSPVDVYRSISLGSPGVCHRQEDTHDG